VPYQLAWLGSGAIVFCTWTFPMQRLFTFRAAPSGGVLAG
jgi:hypothetical protein